MFVIHYRDILQTKRQVRAMSSTECYLCSLSGISFKLQTSAPQIQHVQRSSTASRYLGQGEAQNRDLQLDGKILLKLILQSRIHLPLASAQWCIPVAAVITLLQGGLFFEQLHGQLVKTTSARLVFEACYLMMQSRAKVAQCR